MKIWLDDVRDAPDSTWTVVRSLAELAMFCLTKGTEYQAQGKRPVDLLSDITHVSFDHDLGTEHTGYDACKWFIEYYEMFPAAKIPNMVSHSMNPVGRENIEKYIASFMRNRNDKETANSH